MPFRKLAAAALVAFACFAAVPATLFLLFGMQPFLDWLVKWQRSHPTAKQKSGYTPIQGQWRRTKG